MSALFDRVVRSANQNFHDVIESESKTLPGLHSVHAREKFLRRDRAVERLAWFQAIVAAVACALRELLAEILQQRRAPAMACFRIRHHGAQLLVGDALLAF